MADSLPPIDTSLLPASVRNAGPEAQKLYQTALSFESVLTQQLAKALRISAETLYVRAGILDLDEHGERSVQMTVLADATLTERQKQVLLDIYESFQRENNRTEGE